MPAGVPRHEVLLTAGAERDVEAIHEYIAESDGPLRAAKWLDELRRVIDTLSRSPERGSRPKELLALGIKEYRQVLFKPYRVVYRVFERRVVVLLVVDGRRDLQSILARRLLDA
jgi:toxin ParE1/3/4